MQASGFKGALFDLEAMAVEPIVRALEFLIPVFGLRPLFFKLLKNACPPLKDAKASREKGGPLLWWLWSLRYRRTLLTVEAVGFSQPAAPPCVWFDRRWQPRCVSPDVFIVFVHGGGFCSHTPTEIPFAGEVLPRLAAKGLSCQMIGLDYTLGDKVSRDEQMAQLMYSWDAVHAHIDVLGEEEDGQRPRVVLAGDSAGGHLVTAMVKHLAEQRVEEGKVIAQRGQPADASRRSSVLVPDALVAISPWLDLDMNTPTYSSNGATDYITVEICSDFAQEAKHEENHLYPPKDALSPRKRQSATGSAFDDAVAKAGVTMTKAHGSSSSLEHLDTELSPLAPHWPETMVTVGAGELFAHEGRELVTAIKSECGAGLATLLENPSSPHDWVLLPMFDTKRGDASRAMDQMSEFIAGPYQHNTARRVFSHTELSP